MSTRKLSRMGFAFALMAVVVLVAGCASSGGGSPEVDMDRSAEATDLPGEVVLSADDSGSKVELSAGQVLVVTLESNPTTGYSWEVSGVDGAVLAQVGEAEFQQAPTEGEELVGVGGTETFRFTAAPGETTLTLVYHRPWEKDVEPLETFTVQVVVR